MTGTIIELILLLVAHAAAGIYSSTLKYSKKNHLYHLGYLDSASNRAFALLGISTDK